MGREREAPYRKSGGSRKRWTRKQLYGNGTGVEPLRYESSAGHLNEMAVQ